MRVVAVSRVLNEADVIEPFLRHHAAMLDLHIVLDNGSSDGTVEIMQALRDEGLALQVYQTVSPLFMEQAYNTGLYRFAVGEGADWVLFLDADELLVVREAERPEAVLAFSPAEITCLRLGAFRYGRPSPPPGRHAFEALTHRASTAEMPKIAVRRSEPGRISIYAGNHYAFVDGREDGGLAQDRLLLAHAPDRSPMQLARKIILGRLKPIASGAEAAGHFSTHRAPDFEALKRDPAAWLEGVATAPQPPVLDPVAYRGGPLRYTQPADDFARLIALFAAQAEILAQSHGGIMDRKRLIKQEMMNRGQEVRRLF